MAILETLELFKKGYEIIKWVIKFFHNLYNKFLQFVRLYNPKVPKKTIRVIPQRHNWWSLGSSSGKPAMQIVGDFYITNISDVEILICGVSIRKPNTAGNILVRHPDQNIFGRYPILPGYTTEARADFWIQPPICNIGDKPLVCDINLIDQFGNSHSIRKVKFHSPSKKKEEPLTPQMEAVSDINNTVEREIVAVLQDEVNRYKDCGRRVGGLGSVQTTYKGRTYSGVGTDWREADSPKQQAILPDPENAEIKSDNASTLIKFYNSLKEREQKYFVKSLQKRLSRETGYAPVGYFILFVLYRVGYLNKALETAKRKLQGDSAYGFSDFLRLLDGLLRDEYPNFSTEMLDDIEQFLKGIKEHTFKISERISAVRANLLAKKMEKDKK